MRSKVIVLASVIIVAAGGFWGYSTRANKASAQSQVQYRQAQVVRGEIRSTISGTGPVASVNGVLIRSNQSGTVTQVKAQDGDWVKAGDVVIVMENDNLVAQLSQAQVDLATHIANLDSLLNPLPTAVRGQQLKVESARLTLEQRETELVNLKIKSPHAGMISSVKAIEGSSVGVNALLFTIFDDTTPTFVASVSQGAWAGIKVGQSAKVEIPGFGSVTGTVGQNAAAAITTNGNRDSNVPVEILLPEMSGIRAGMVGQVTFDVEGLDYPVVATGSILNDAVEVRALVAGIAGPVRLKEGDRVNAGDTLLELTNEQLRVSIEQAANDLQVAEYNLSTLVDPSQDPAGQVRTLRSKIEAAQITLEIRQSDVSELQIKAPVDGQLSALSARVGDKVTNNLQLFRIADYGMMQVTITVDELDIAKTKLGQAALLTLDALPGRPFRGKVTKINPEGIFRNDIATFEVTITVDNPQGLMAGMNTTVNIIVEDRVGLRVPAQSVQVSQGRATVKLLVNDEPVEKEIKIGLRTGQQVEVLEGLTEGESVITTIIQPPQNSFNLPFLGGGQRPQQQTPAPSGAAGQTPGGGFVRPGGGGLGGGQRP